MTRMMVAWILVFASVGCTTAPDAASAVGELDRSGAVGFQDISGLASAPNGRVTLAENESFLEALEGPHSPMPAYPSGLLGASLEPQTVCVSVSLDARGDIISIVPVVELPACPAAVAPAFVAAVTETVGGWTYEPARRCIFPTVAIKDMAFASCNGGQEVAIAVTLTYRFVFEQRDGKGSVRLGS